VVDTEEREEGMEVDELQLTGNPAARGILEDRRKLGRATNYTVRDPHLEGLASPRLASLRFLPLYAALCPEARQQQPGPHLLWGKWWPRGGHHQDTSLHLHAPGSGPGHPQTGELPGTGPGVREKMVREREDGEREDGERELTAHVYLCRFSWAIARAWSSSSCS
jgi:hypothetical protein